MLPPFSDLLAPPLSPEISAMVEMYRGYRYKTENRVLRNLIAENILTGSPLKMPHALLRHSAARNRVGSAAD